MSNRSTEWLIVWSPADKYKLNSENTNKIIKLLKKLTTKYNIAYEEGNNNNPHYDIVAVFKSKQARTDIANTLCRNLSDMEWWPSNKGPLTISPISDFSYRLGYNLKEALPFLFADVDTSEGIELSEREFAILHYNKTNKERDKVDKIKNRFKYISKKQSLYTINKYQLKNNIPDPKNPQQFELLISKMLLEGYYFDMKQQEKYDIFRFYISVLTQQTGLRDVKSWTLDEETFMNTFGPDTQDFQEYIPDNGNICDAHFNIDTEQYIAPIQIEAKKITLEKHLKLSKKK